MTWGYLEYSLDGVRDDEGEDDVPGIVDFAFELDFNDLTTLETVCKNFFLVGSMGEPRY